MGLDASRAALDIHETAGDDYKTAVRNTFVWCSDQFEHWRRMPCVDGAGERISKQTPHEKLNAELSANFVNRRLPARLPAPLPAQLHQLRGGDATAVAPDEPLTSTATPIVVTSRPAAASCRHPSTRPPSPTTS
jgi:hypothetical protein